MVKRYLEPIEVEAPEGSLEAFWWRGKRYGVRQVIGRWREAGGWWEADEGARPWQAGESREILRIEAVASAPGIYEIARDLRAGTWSMLRVLD